jgi:myo-inositol-1(or 4)-monophosphatase
MAELDPDRARDGLVDAVCRAGFEVLSVFQRTDDVEAREKPDGTLVSEADLAAEAVILEVLRRIAPTVPVLSEEAGGRVPLRGSFFLVDPLDGTSSFARRHTSFSISAALVERRHDSRTDVLAAVVLEPVSGRLWSAVRGLGTRLGRAPLTVDGQAEVGPLVRVSNRGPKKGSRSLLLYDAALRFGEMVPNQLAKLNAITRAVPSFEALRVLGSNALQLAYVSSGFAEASVTDAVGGPHDIAPLLLVEEAGGVVTDLDSGGVDVMTSQGVVASNGLHHHDLIEALAGMYPVSQFRGQAS